MSQRNSIKIFLIIFLLSLQYGCIKSDKVVPVAKQGILDLRNYNFEQDGPVSLRGEWEIYWQKYLFSENFLDNTDNFKKSYIKVPHIWSGYMLENKKLPKFGYATYRLIVLISPKNEKPLAFKFPIVGTSYEAYLNGDKITSVGKIGTSFNTTVPRYFPHVVDFIPQSFQLEIIIRVANFHHRVGGLREVILFGRQEDIRELREKRLAIDIFLFGSVFIIGIYYFAIFLIRKKERASLYFSLLCFTNASRELLVSDRYFMHLFPQTSFEMLIKLEFCSLFFVPPLFIMFLAAIFPKETKNKFLISIQIIGAFVILFTIAFPARLSGNLVIPYEIVIITCMLYGLYVIVLACLRKREGSIIFLLGYITYALAGLNEILFTNAIIQTGYFLSLGLIIFIFSQAFILSLRFSKTFDKVEELSENLSNLISNSPIGIVRTTPDGHFLSANPAMATILGYYSPDDLISSIQDISTQLYVSSYDRIKFSELLEKKNKVIGFETKFYRKDEREIWVSISARSVFDLKGKLLYYEAYAEDITERKIAELIRIKNEEQIRKMNIELEQRVMERTSELEESLKRLQDTQKQLIQSEKLSALGGLVAGVAHEINTPIGVGVSAASYLVEKTKTLEANYSAGEVTEDDFEKYIKNSTETASTILTNLERAYEIIRSFKQISVDQSSQEKREFNLKEYLEGVLISLRPQYKRTKHNIELNCPDKIEINSYPGAISQIITNFITNSLMHAFEGIEIGRIVFDICVEGEYVIICYSDNGNGMDEKIIERIYDPFFTTKRGKGGSGLGMHIVYNTVTQILKGEISCVSKPGKGVKFTIKIPITI